MVKVREHGLLVGSSFRCRLFIGIMSVSALLSILFIYASVTGRLPSDGSPSGMEIGSIKAIPNGNMDFPALLGVLRRGDEEITLFDSLSPEGTASIVPGKATISYYYDTDHCLIITGNGPGVASRLQGAYEYGQNGCMWDSTSAAFQTSVVVSRQWSPVLGLVIPCLGFICFMIVDSAVLVYLEFRQKGHC
jgi:hypothetical protein